MPMDLQLKARVRAELFRRALAGEFPTYTEFFEGINPGATMGAFPYTLHFDQIAMEERSHGYPDITFIVRRAGSHPQYPGRIDFRPAGHPPDEDQLTSLRNGTDKIIELYCPGTNNPYR
jgi:hypothetical protein